MKKYLQVVMGTMLFAGFTNEETSQMLENLSPVVRNVEKGSVLLLAGDENDDIGIVLQGRLEAVKHGPDGSQFTVADMAAGAVFGYVLSAGHTKSPVTVFAAENSVVMNISANKLFARPKSDEELYRHMLANLVGVMSDKYFALDKRLDLLLTHGIKKRVAAFLLDKADGRQGQWFSTGFSRAQLASYLGCERSALSREISKMVKAGLIETQGERFCLLNIQALSALF